MQTIPEYICTNLDTRQSIHFAPSSWFWVTSISGEDGLDVSISESQSAGQIGKTINGRSVGSRSVTVTGDIVGDYDASERLLKRLIQRVLLCAGRRSSARSGGIWTAKPSACRKWTASRGYCIFNSSSKRLTLTGVPRRRSPPCWAAWTLPGSLHRFPRPGPGISVSTGRACTRRWSIPATRRLPLL